MKKILFLFVILLSLTSCVETIVVGSVVGGAAVLSDGSLFDLSQDGRIKTAIKKGYKKSNEYINLKKIQIIVYNGKVLLTGYVHDEQYKSLAVQIASEVKPDLVVYDEIMIFGQDYKTNSINDTYISSEISNRLRFAKDIKSGNYEYEVVDANVFIMGRARSKKEFKKVISVLRHTKSVKKVVSYIFILEEPTKKE